MNKNGSAGFDDAYINDDPDEAARKYHEATKGLTIPQLTVSQALRTNLERFQVRGQIATVTTVYNMVSAVNLTCSGCSNQWKVSYEKKPKFNIPDTNRISCNGCKNEEATINLTPEWIPALDIQLQDTEKFNDIERLTVKLFGNDTIDVRAGEIILVKGYRDVIRRNEGNNSGRYITVFYSESAEYTGRDKIELNQQVIQNIEARKSEVTKEGKNIIDLLVEKLSPTVVGHEFVKKSLLLAAANAGIENNDNRDPKRLRIHILVAGDPSLAKSTMIKKISELLPNGRFESAIGSSGIGLTFTVTKEPNESYVLRLGAIPLASGSICAINEMNQTPLEQQKHYFDFMEEGKSTSGKYAIPARIIGHTTIIGSANPRQGRWKDQDSDKIQLDEISILPQVMDRFDIICVLRQGQPDVQKDWEYIGKKNQIRRDIKAGVYDGYDEYLKKYLKYARTFNPNSDISEDAVNMLDDYWVKMGQTETDDRGRPRKLEGLYRIAVAISKIKLKNQVDIEDAIETMQHYNVVLLNFSHLVPVSQSPKEVARETCISILQEFPYPIASKELFKTARDKNEQVKAYVGNDLSIETNWKLRKVCEDLLNDSHVILVQEKPTVFKWKGEGKVKSKASRQASEVSDVSEAHGDYGYDYGKSGGDNKTRPCPTPSDTSDTSDSTSQPEPRYNGTNRNGQDRENIKPNQDAGPGPSQSHGSHGSHSVSESPYQHLIMTEDMPTLEKTAYRCKEHPNIWDIDIKNLEVSHFRPFHSKEKV
jgi:replicative DNA helicase Mcm